MKISKELAKGSTGLLVLSVIWAIYIRKTSKRIR